MNNIVPTNAKLKTNIDYYEDLFTLGYNLIPLNGKVPLIKDWKQWQSKRIPQALFSNWLENPFESNNLTFGLVTGYCSNVTLPAITVIDADNEQAAEVVRSKCPATLEIKTTRGIHFWYRSESTGCPEVDCESLGLNAKTISIKGLGGYVRSPNATRYPSREITPIGLQSLPHFSIDWLQTKSEKVFINSNVDFYNANVGDEENVRQAKDYLNGLSPTKASGGASSYMLRVASEVRYGFALTDEQAIELLLEWGSMGIDENDNPYPWTLAEIKHKVRDCKPIEPTGSRLSLDYSPEYVTTFVTPFEVPKVQEPPETIPAPVAQKPNAAFRGIFDMIAIAETQKEDWLIENWIEFGSLAMLTGDPFSGKSSIVTELIGSIAQQRMFANFDVPRCPILSIDLENRERIIVKRLERAVNGDFQSLADIWSSLYLPEDFLPLDAGRVESLIEHYKKRQNGQKPLVVIDTFRSAFDASEMDVDQVKKLLYPLQRVAQRQQAAILILHHRPKSGAKYSGQSSIPGALDYMWCWESDQQTRRGRLSLEGTRGDLAPSLTFSLSDEQRNIFMPDVPAVSLPQLEKLDDLLRDILKNGEMNQKNLVANIKMLWDDAPKRDAVIAIIEDVAKRGDLIIKSKGLHNQTFYELI